MSARLLYPEIRLLFLLLPALVILFGCSDDDSDPAELSRDVEFIAFANTGSEEIQMNVTYGDGNTAIISLSDELALDELPFYRRDINNSSVAYYFWQDQRSSARYKDLNSGEIYIEDDICDFSDEGIPERVIRRVSGNASFVVMPYASFPEAAPPLFALRILEKATGLCRDLPVTGINATGIENYAIAGNLLGLYYLEEGTGNPLITLVDLSSGSIGETLILDENFQAATFRGTELWIFDQDSTYLVYNTQSETFVRTGSAPGLPLQDPGMFESRFSGNRLLVRYVYQQPSLFFAQPSVYDFDAGALTEGATPFLPALQEEIERQTGDRVLFGNYAVDLPSGTLAIAYVRGNGLPEGGVVLTDFGGTWLEVLPLPYVPEHLEIRNVE
jgi:hypothetical protein